MGAAGLTVGGQALWAGGQTDDVSVSLQDEDLVVTAGNGDNVSAALQSPDHHLDTDTQQHMDFSRFRWILTVVVDASCPGRSQLLNYACFLLTCPD